MDRTYSLCQDCKNLSAPYLIVYKLYSKTLATFKLWYIYLILSWLTLPRIPRISRLKSQIMKPTFLS